MNPRGQLHNPRERAPDAQCTGRWVCHRASLDATRTQNFRHISNRPHITHPSAYGPATIHNDLWSYWLCGNLKSKDCTGRSLPHIKSTPYHSSFYLQYGHNTQWFMNLPPYRNFSLIECIGRTQQIKTRTQYMFMAHILEHGSSSQTKCLTFGEDIITKDFQ